MDIGHTANLMKRQKRRLKLNVLPNCHSKASIFATTKKRTQLFYTPDSIRGDPPVLRCALHRCCNLHRKRGALVQKDTRAAAVLEFASRSVWSEWEVGKNSRKKKSHRTKHMVRDWKEYWLHNTKKRENDRSNSSFVAVSKALHTHTHTPDTIRWQIGFPPNYLAGGKEWRWSTSTSSGTKHEIRRQCTPTSVCVYVPP